ncbi:Regulator of rDNA transcription protein 5 [Maudiozyma exigua]|uniref:Regulator of rDNA transcription protein 5 n=1 Tax=Maudiozyma exigua TaxID=34358 RepID=A0A9P6W9M4_MAUEX|nr:Regulator of rDNA transcription protein 5 [Kazachstania exigua]
MLRFRHQPENIPTHFAEPSKRVLLWNLSYLVSEKELLTYLKGYGAVWVVLPVQSLYGFRKNHPHPLGIAYAEFESNEKATEAIERLFNQIYHGRPLKLRYHQPYVPKKKSKNNPRDTQSVARGIELNTFDSDINPISSENIDLTNPVELTEEERVAPAVVPSKLNVKKRAVSTETVYCKILPEGTTDLHLRQHFKAFHPKEIWIFKSAPTRSRMCFSNKSHSFTSALITLETEELLKRVAKIMSKKKLLDNKVIVRPAYLTKIEEVKRIAEQEELETPIEEIPRENSGSVSTNMETAEAQFPITIPVTSHEIVIDSEPYIGNVPTIPEEGPTSIISSA